MGEDGGEIMIALYACLCLFRAMCPSVGVVFGYLG